MRLLLFIDSFGPGGAQRQMLLLAAMLTERGHRVLVVTYHPHEFYKNYLQDPRIRHDSVRCRFRPLRPLALLTVIRRERPDALLAFQLGAGLYAEVLALLGMSPGLVVCERSAIKHSHRIWGYKMLRQFHRFASGVMANSHTNRLMIEASVPALVGRVTTVYNGVDLKEFSPAAPVRFHERGRLQMLVVSTHKSLKNAVGLARAVKRVQALRPDLLISVDWYGARPPRSASYSAAQQCVEALGLEPVFRFHAPQTEVANLYRAADVLMLPSLHEGLPNVVCEAMACGRPILMSSVCDAGNLVDPGRNGFLFDPLRTEHIAAAIMEMADTPAAVRASMGRQSRKMSEQLFDPTVWVRCYERLLHAAAAGEAVAVEHWPPQVPETAYGEL